MTKPLSVENAPLPFTYVHLQSNRCLMRALNFLCTVKIRSKTKALEQIGDSSRELTLSPRASVLYSAGLAGWQASFCTVSGALAAENESEQATRTFTAVRARAIPWATCLCGTP